MILQATIGGLSLGTAFAQYDALALRDLLGRLVGSFPSSFEVLPAPQRGVP